MSSRVFSVLNLFVFLLPSLVSAQGTSSHETKEPPDPTGVLSLAQCLGLALEHSPQLAVYGWEQRMAEARTLQAGLRPNPELSFAIEDIGIGGSGGSSSSSSTVGLTPAPAIGLGMDRESISDSSGGFDSAEFTLTLSQLVEMGGKRMKRIRLAQDDARVVDMDYEVLRAEILSSTARAFYEVLVLQQRLATAKSFAQFAEEAHGITRARVEAGKISPLEETRSDVELRGIQLETEHAEHELAAARIRLAANWGSDTPHFESVAGELSIPAPPENLDTYLNQAEDSPDVKRWIAERARRESALQLERANARTDITLSAGLRATGTGGRARSSGYGLSSLDGARFSRGSSSPDDNHDFSVLVGISVPLKFFNRNQGRILEAEHALNQLSDAERAMQSQIRTEVSAQWQTLAATYDEAKTLDEVILPKAEEAFEATQEGYRQGKFGLLDVLLSQRALFDAKRELLETAARHYAAKVEVERYTGQAIDTMTTEASPIEETTP